MFGFVPKSEYDKFIHRFSDLESRVNWLEENAATHSDTNKLLETIDDNQSERLQEQHVLLSQINRHEAWIRKIAGDTGIVIS